MGVAHLPQWDITAIEIALDLETPRSSIAPAFFFSGPAEPRVCLVAAFALTAQLRHMITAVDRVVPSRLPATLRVEPAASRSVKRWAPDGLAMQPMVSLIRLQRKLIRAIDPGLAKYSAGSAFPAPREMEASVADYVRSFIPANALPTFEARNVLREFPPARFKLIGITMYRLGNDGTPQSILKHWAYAPSPRGSSVHLKSGP